jgi:hypothetical protein
MLINPSTPVQRFRIGVERTPDVAIHFARKKV